MVFPLLKAGDKLGILCPSSAMTPGNLTRVPAMEAYLKSLGLDFVYGKTTTLQAGYLAGTDEERIKDIHELFLDPQIKAILCLKGGYGLTRIIDRLDYTLIACHPKLVIGFSDVTALLYALYQKVGLPSLHGQVGIFLGSPKQDEFSKKNFQEMTMNYVRGKVLQSPTLGEPFNDLKGEGVLIGGNLSLITALLGTPFEMDFKEKIVFIEEVNEEGYRIDRMLSSLRLAGKLKEANGFVLGHFTDCGTDKTKIDHLIEEYFPKDIPVITHFASGHEFPFLNLPIGLKVGMDAKKQTITILEELYEKSESFC